MGEDRLTWHERTKPKAEEQANDAPDLAALAALHASDAPPHIWLVNSPSIALRLLLCIPDEAISRRAIPDA